jgi:fibronectin-binding autotransporter adhesin
VTGGLVTHSPASASISLGYQNGGTGTMTVTGGTVDNAGRDIIIRESADSPNVTVNINGGTIITNAVRKASAAGTGVVNFNGGTLKPGVAGQTLVNGLNGLTAYVNGAFGSFSGGAVIDTVGLDTTISAVLLSPTGSGVSGLTVGSAGSGYIGAPILQFTGGGGTGATGYAEVDLDPTSPTFGQITGVVMTNPGIGYTSTPTVTLLGGGGAGGAVTVSGTVANTSGGLTKNGTGKLTLTGAGSTYTGGTTINAGTLALGVASALADTGNVTIAGGTFDVATFNDTVATVTLQSGGITGSTGVLTSTADFVLQSGTVNFTGSGGLGGSVNVTKTTGGTVTLTDNGLGSFANGVNVNGGTLAFSTSAQLGSGVGSNTIGVNGGTLSYTGALTTDLTPSRVLTIGASGATLETTQSTGVLNFSGGASSGAGGNLTKTGSGTVIIAGTTDLNGGAASINNGMLTASFGTGGISALTVGGSGNMNFQNGTVEALALTGALNLANGARLGFDLGAAGTPGLSDQINSVAAAIVSGTITLDFANAGGLGTGTYDLISALSGLNSASYVLGTAPGGFNYGINVTDLLISLTVTAFQPRYWTGSQATTSWATVNAGPLTNWSTDPGGSTNATDIPGTAHTVVFSATNATGPAISTTLDADFTIDSLQFTSAPTGVTSVTIAEGTAGSELTLAPSSTVGGIEVQDNAGTVTISAPLIVGAAGGAPSQTWSVTGTGNQLIVTGNTTFTDLVNKTGAGALTLSGANSGAGGVTLTGGTLNVNSTTALGTGTFTIGAGTIIDASAGAIVNASNNLQNWNGSFAFAGSNDLNLGTGAVTLGGNIGILATANTLTVGGVIDDGSSTFSLTKAGAGTLVLGGNNAYDGLTDLMVGTLTLTGNNSGAVGGVTMAAGTFLNLGHANALGTGTLTINGGTIDNTSGSSPLNLGGNVLQNWNGNFTFTGTNSMNMGTGAVTLGATTQVTVSANTLTVGGAIGDGASVFGVTKAGAGTLTLGGASTYEGATTINQGTLGFTADQNLTAGTNSLVFGAAAGSTDVGALDLGTASATFGGAMTVQTNSASNNTIDIGAGKVLRVDGQVTVGANTGGSTVTNLVLSGAGTFKVGDTGTPTNANFQVGGNTTANITNDATVDMSGLDNFVAELGTGTFRVGDTVAGTGTAGSSVILADNTTIRASLITSNGGGSGVTQVIKLGSGINNFHANTITIGAGDLRSSGTLDFNTSTGTLEIRAQNGTGRAAMNVGNFTENANVSPTSTVNLNGHSVDLLLGTLTIGLRSTFATGNATGNFSFDTGTLDATTINLGHRSGADPTTANATGNLDLGGGTTTIGTLAMSVNSVTAATTSGDAISTLDISGGTNAITTMTMGVISVSGATNVAASDTSATVTVTGGTTTIGTLTMGANNSAAAAVNGANTAASAFNISAGSVNVTGNLGMGATTLRALNAATASISITGTGSLTVEGSIRYTDGLGTETNTITLNGGTLDMTDGTIGGTGSGANQGVITFNAQSGTLRNLNQLNGGGLLDKTTTGTLILDTANSYTGATVVSAGVLAISHGGALGGTTNGTSVAAGGTLALSGGITVSGESLTLTADSTANNASLSNASGSNTWSGNLTVDTGTGSGRALLESAAGSNLLVTGNINLAAGSNDFVLRGDGNGEISGQITGSQRLFKSSVGTGTWILSGDNSGTFTGRTTISSGTIQISSESNLGAAPGSFVASQLTLGGGSSNGTLKTTASTALSANRGVTLGTGGGTFETATATTLTVNGVITGPSGALNKTGAGTLVLTAANTYEGTTNVSAGTLQVGNGALLARSLAREVSTSLAQVASSLAQAALRAARSSVAVPFWHQAWVTRMPAIKH